MNTHQSVLSYLNGVAPHPKSGETKQGDYNRALSFLKADANCLRSHLANVGNAIYEAEMAIYASLTRSDEVVTADMWIANAKVREILDLATETMSNLLEQARQLRAAADQLEVTKEEAQKSILVS